MEFTDNKRVEAVKKVIDSLVEPYENLGNLLDEEYDEFVETAMNYVEAAIDYLQEFVQE